MKLLTNSERREMKELALRIFMSFSATVASVGTFYFILSILSWFDLLNAGVAYLALLVGMPVLAIGGMILSTRLYNRYIWIQAQLCPAEDAEFYAGMLSGGYYAHSLLHLLLAGSVLGLLTSMAGYDSLVAFWLTGALLTVTFVIGCIVMAKVRRACIRMESELIELAAKRQVRSHTIPLFRIDTRNPR